MQRLSALSTHGLCTHNFNHQVGLGKCTESSNSLSAMELELHSATPCAQGLPSLSFPVARLQGKRGYIYTGLWTC
jgi:hypothetical protein